MRKAQCATNTLNVAGLFSDFSREYSTQVGAIFNTVTRQDIRKMQDQVMDLSRLKIPLFFAYDVVHGQVVRRFISRHAPDGFHRVEVKGRR